MDEFKKILSALLVSALFVGGFMLLIAATTCLSGESERNAKCEEKARSLPDSEYDLYRSCYSTPKAYPCFCYGKVVSSRR